ncbi:MAG: hypothetical protein LUE17_00460, partial [Planctomycetaceae bacterium]|nr:hypothetical protein [Planctomycetaceae bacterium]
IVSLPTDESGWTMRDRRNRRRQAAVASSSVDMDSLLIVVGDFARLPDSAAENLFASLAGIMPAGLTVQDRRLSPGDENLSDTLLALVSPEEMRDWSDAALAGVAQYLRRGGHLWLDADSPDRARPPMQKLAAASGGDYGPLPATHQLAETGNVDALYIDERLAAIVTYQDWRKNWRFGSRNGGTLDFLRRSLNYFLSGNADQGIVLDTAPTTGDRLVEPVRDVMPDLLAGGVGGDGEVWDEFGPDTAAAWRMPSWSDTGRIAAVSDGQGGRALRLDLGAPVKGRAAAYRTLTPPQDFSAVDYVSLDAYYDGEGEASVSMVFTVERPEGWQDYETTTLPLVKGWNRIRFNLGDRTFRALSAGGSGGTALPGRERTGRAGFFLYRDGNGPGVALFRDIRLHSR